MVTCPYIVCANGLWLTSSLVPYHDNQTGSYIRTFSVPWTVGNDQIRLRFEGVDSSFHVWVNGTEVGYSQGARNPTEFDITHLLNADAPNTLSVRVYQFCDGSYIEDQGEFELFAARFRY